MTLILASWAVFYKLLLPSSTTSNGLKALNASLEQLSLASPPIKPIQDTESCITGFSLMRNLFL